MLYRKKKSENNSYEMTTRITNAKRHHVNEKTASSDARAEKICCARGTASPNTPLYRTGPVNSYKLNKDKNTPIRCCPRRKYTTVAVKEASTRAIRSIVRSSCTWLIHSPGTTAIPHGAKAFHRKHVLTQYFMNHGLDFLSVNFDDKQVDLL